jgi:hypothetical protein
VLWVRWAVGAKPGRAERWGLQALRRTRRSLSLAVEAAALHMDKVLASMGSPGCFAPQTAQSHLRHALAALKADATATRHAESAAAAAASEPSTAMVTGAAAVDALAHDLERAAAPPSAEALRALEHLAAAAAACDSYLNHKLLRLLERAHSSSHFEEEASIPPLGSNWSAEAQASPAAVCERLLLAGPARIRRLSDFSLLRRVGKGSCVGGRLQLSGAATYVIMGLTRVRYTANY